MGTRSLTYVKDEKGKTICCMYRQYDGYLEGHGSDLGKLLQAKRLINGISSGATMETCANGMGCLAAQVVSHFKNELGGIYLYPTDTANVYQIYEYTVYNMDSVIWIKCSSHSEVILHCPASEFCGKIAELNKSAEEPA